MMFEHAAVKPFWPVIFFLPWLVLGIAYLAEWMLDRRIRALRNAGGLAARTVSPRRAA